ncbi:hypothetical protein [Georgenia sp. Marseille-Q6866]
MTTTERVLPARTDRATRRLLVLLPLVALVLGGALWWWSNPRAFEGAGGIGIIPGEPGRPLFVGMVRAPTDAGVSLLDARPRIVSDDTSAKVTVHVCRIADRDLGAVGSAYDTVDDMCASLREPSGPLEALDQLVVEIVAHEEGELVMDGLDVVYRTGLQRGTQWAGMHTTVEVGPPGSTS